MKDKAPTTQVSRRQFIGAGIAAIASLATPHSMRAEETGKKMPEPKLRFSSWLLGISGDLEQQLDFVEKAGFEAVELRGGIPGNRQNWVKALSHRQLAVSALDCIHFTDMVGSDPGKRQQCIDSIKYAIDAAHELKAPVLICVPPRYGKGVDLPDSETTRKMLLETLSPLGDLAAKAGTSIGIEAVNRKSVNCLHTLAETAGFCREIGSPGVSVVADFSIMMQEETNQTGAILSGGAYVKQVHLSSRKRTLPGSEKEDEQQFLEGFRGLKIIGYNRYCSFESGKANYEAGVMKSMAFLRDVWARA